METTKQPPILTSRRTNMSALRWIPLSWLRPLRLGAVRLPRGSLLRSACVAFLKLASRSRAICREVEHIIPLDENISLDACDSMVTDAVYWFGVQGYEGILADIWKRLCAGATNVLEIGGNVGLYSVLGARSMRAGRYTVVEPLPELATVLRRNVERNLGPDSAVAVEIIEGAVIPGTIPRMVVISIPDEGRSAPVGAHLSEGTELDRRTCERKVEVRGIPIRDLISDRDVIKIDAEGIEYNLLSGIRPQLVTNRPVIVVEILPEASNLAGFIASLASECDYTINVVPAYGSQKIITIAPDRFTSKVPGQFNSKDVVLARFPLFTGM